MANEQNQYGDVWAAGPAAVSVYLTLSLLAYLGALAVIWCGHDLVPWCGPLPPERLAILKLLAYAFCFGGLGATTYSIHGLYQHVAGKDYDPAYCYWYLFRGPLGAVLGVIACLLMQSGVLVFSDVELAQMVSSPPATFKSKAAICSLAFLGGFSTNQFTYKLQELARTMFGEGTHKKKLEKKSKGESEGSKG